MPRCRNPLPRVGISRCLLGDPVRYDGEHKLHASLISALAPLVEWVSVCPELEVGMGVPREPIHLVESASGVPSGTHRVRLLGVTSGEDWTSRMAAYSERRVRELADARLSGFVLKARSPSCGMGSPTTKKVPGVISSNRGNEITPGTFFGPGLFAHALLTGIEDLPVEEETRLDDPAVRADFIERVFAYQRQRSHFCP